LQHWGTRTDVRERWLRHGLHLFEQLIDQFSRAFVIPLNDAIIDRGVTLMARYHLKSYDAIHVASAIEAGLSDIAATDGDFARVTEITVHLTFDV
jgi:predicted nucleic acid-binding protein